MDKNYNYLGGYGYGYGYQDNESLTPRENGVDQKDVDKTVDKKIDELVGDAPEEMDTIAELAAAVQELGGQDLSEINEKLDEKADKTELEGLFASVEYEENTIKFYDKEGNEVGTLDATDFVKDGMIQSVVLNENNELVISFNTDAGAEDITVSLGDAFKPNNYYTKDECDARFAQVSALNDYSTTEQMTEAITTSASTLNDSIDAVDAKVNAIVIPELPENISAFTNDANYVTSTEMESALEGKMDTVELSEVATSGSYNDLEDKPEIPSLDGYATEAYVGEEIAKIVIPDTSAFITSETASQTYQAKGNYLTSTDLDDYATKAYVGEEIAKIDIPDVSGFATTEAMNAAIEGITIPEIPENVSDFTNDAGYLTTATGDERYYGKEAANSIFVAQSAFEDAMDLKANKTELDAYATDNDLVDAVNALTVRLNRLEATNNFLVENNTTKGSEIAEMTAEQAAEAEITVSTPEAVNALTTNKEFKSVNLIGAEVGSNDVIYTTATEDVTVSGVTVSGTKGTGNGKIVYATNDITISNVNIEPGCTVYNVFEGSQDRTEGHSIDSFTATNVTVNDVDLAHNVFNIYQFNDGANVLIKDSTFNLDVANSNVLRVSNVTNADNVTITFENVDWTYENKEYAASDIEWAGLLIYQPYGNDIAFSGDTSHTQTWTINVKNCRYNGEPITQNNVGEISQAIYQYKVNNQGCEAPSAFGTISFE